MDLRVIVDPPAGGAWNMAVDEALLATAAQGGPLTLRCYRWETPTLSLGYFQQAAERARHLASRRCPLIRRASGGGAIVHDREWTYSLAVPDRRGTAAAELYDEVHGAILKLLAHWQISAELAGEATRPTEFLCFQRRAVGDIVVGGFKIGGSAQRRLRAAVLQHGSVLYERSPAAPELPGLRELADSPESQCTDTQVAAFPWELATALGQAWDLTPAVAELEPAERSCAQQLARDKFAAVTWTHKR